MKFYPAILSDSLETIAHQVKIAQSIPQVTVVQIDILDGLFADNLSILPSDLFNLELGRLKADLHLMTEEPLDFVHELLINSKASARKKSVPVRAVIAQVERMSYQDQYLEELEQNNFKKGLSLDIFTPLPAINEKIYPQLDYIQLMGIEAGFQGQQLKEIVYQKIKDLKNYANKKSLNFEIIVDGGVKLHNLKKIKEAGADSAAIGSSLWTAKEPKKIAKKIANI